MFVRVVDIEEYQVGAAQDCVGYQWQEEYCKEIEGKAKEEGKEQAGTIVDAGGGEGNLVEDTLTV